MTFITL